MGDGLGSNVTLDCLGQSHVLSFFMGSLDIREFRKPFPELIFPSHLLKCGRNKKMRRDQHMSSNVHPNFQDKKIKYEVSLVSGVLNFTSAYHRTLRTSKNAAEQAEVSQLAVDESSEFDNFSYGKSKKRAISMSPA